MPVTIQNVTPGSPAARKRIRPGETLLRINGHVIEICGHKNREGLLLLYL